MARSITSANVVMTITVPGLYDSPQQFSGYSTDKVWSAEAVKLAETMMGVDGHLSAGYVPNPVPFTVSLQADSLGIDIFEAITNATRQAREVYRISGTISVPATGKVYTGTNGVLDTAAVIPDASKTLQAQNFIIIWEKLVPSLA
jgi:hypothetical protein